jgi:K+-transporting ATPase C subunit
MRIRKMSDNNNNQPSARPKILGPALRTVLIMIAVVGVAYPLVLVGIGQEVLPDQSHGSMIRLDSGNRPSFFTDVCLQNPHLELIRI